MAEESVVFDRAADFYDETRGFPPGTAEPVAAMIARSGGLTASSRALEIGVGTGRIALPVSAHVAGYYGVDLSSRMMGRLLEKRQSEPVHVAQSDATQLPFPNDAFDVAIAVHVFHLIPNWQGALAEVGRVLRPGAPLLTCWNRGRSDARAKQLWEAWEAVIPPVRRETLGARPEDDPHFAEDEGWVKAGEPQIYEYTSAFVPLEHIDRLRRRVWSRLWRLTDTEIEAGVAAVEAKVADLFDDPSEEITLTGEFYVLVYLPGSSR